MTNNRVEQIIKAGNINLDTHGIARNDIFSTYVNHLSIDILDHGYFWGDRKWNQFDVISPYSRIYLMSKHEGWLETDKGSIPLLPGKMYLVPPYYKVNLRTNDKIEKFYFHFTTEFDGVEIFEGLKTCLVLPLEDKFLSRYTNTFESSEIADLLLFKSIVYETVSLFVRAYLPEIQNRLIIASKYKQILHYIEENLSAILCAKEISAKLGLSYLSLTRNYKKDTGITLNNYIHSKVVYKAIHLLLQSKRTVKSISEELGFIDEFYFSRFFKKHMEYSPREYRRVNKTPETV